MMKFALIFAALIACNSLAEPVSKEMFSSSPRFQVAPMKDLPPLRSRPAFNLDDYDPTEVEEMLSAANDIAMLLQPGLDRWTRDDVTGFRPFSEGLDPEEPKAGINFRNCWGISFCRDAEHGPRLKGFNDDCSQIHADAGAATEGRGLKAKAALEYARNVLKELGYEETEFPVHEPEVNQRTSGRPYTVTWEWKYRRYSPYFRIRVDPEQKRVVNFHTLYLSSADRSMNAARRNAERGAKDPYLVRCFLAAREMAKGLDVDGASSWGVEDVRWNDKQPFRPPQDLGS